MVFAKYRESLQAQQQQQMQQQLMVATGNGKGGSDSGDLELALDPEVGGPSDADPAPGSETNGHHILDSGEASDAAAEEAPQRIVASDEYEGD